MKKCFQISLVIIGIITAIIACTKQNDISNSAKWNGINAFNAVYTKDSMNKKDSIPHKRDSLPPRRDSLPPRRDSLPLPPVVDSFHYPKDSVPHCSKPRRR